VWPRWSDGRVAVVSRHVVALGRGADSVSGAGEGDPEAALAALGSLPLAPASRFATRQVEVWVDDAWVRMFGTTWPESIDDVRTFRQYVGARFEQRFELPAADWSIVAPGAWPGRPVLCVAVPAEFVEHCRAATRRMGLRLARMLPIALVEVGTSLAARPKTTTLFVGSASPQRTVFLLRAGRLSDCAVLPDCERIGALAAALFEERGVLAGGVRRTLRVDLDRHAATMAMLRREPLPVAATDHDPSGAHRAAARSAQQVLR
jgi:hypothetical protein